MITRQDATDENEFHAEGGCTVTVGPRGGVKVRMEIWRTNGAPKEWKRNDNVRTPVKYGMRSYSYVLWPSDAHLWHTRANCPILNRQKEGLES